MRSRQARSASPAAILTPIVGRLGDMFGKRRMLVVTLAAFAVGNALAALAPNVWLLILARVVQGAGGGIFPLCFGLINDTFSAERRPGALGLVSAISGIGAGSGPVTGPGPGPGPISHPHRR
ncbi:hypothetical protein Franean1_1575 [Parafrankia sp. EAN1pec]|uniref:MFS transporter n=1 Tax=Parafrankia sp. (strain EAN1pec) TaxID=298653 RepID=UPI0000540F51|nr:hypothetical protein Franean1_1575 [Frankia sp. EAN1pec]